MSSHTLHLAFLGKLSQPIDPDIYYASQGENIIDNVYQTLVNYKTGTPTPTIVPGLATSWSISSNGLVYTFKLRHGVKFHDGTPFTCAAIAPSFARRLAVNQGPAYMVQDVASVNCSNPYDAVITLKAPENDFLDVLASEYGPKMLSPTALKLHSGTDHAQSWLAHHDAGTGPYTVAAANSSTGYVLKYYPGYWGPKPYYTTVDISIVPSISTQQLELDQGKLSAILTGLPTRTIPALRSNPKLAVHELPTEAGLFLNVNPHAPGLSTTAARRAVLDAINPSAVLATAYPDGAAKKYDGVYPHHQLPSGVARQKTTYKPGLLAKLASSLHGKTITIAYDTGRPNEQEAANVIQTELASAGVHAIVVSLTGAQIFGSVGQVTNYPSIDVSSPWPDAASPYTWAHIAYDPTGGLAYFQCPNPAASAALTRALAIPSASAAQAAYVSAGELYASSYCWEWLSSRNDVMVTQSGLGGVKQAHSVMAPSTLLFDALRPKKG